ncbi:MAG: hypothetical protein LBL08_00835 [Candidatus Nomurabacteria bacterium]|jgi:hypothetical protein|nr:hypothetical protein [Candidatus Nomurabacteria bacterium]
MANIDAGRETVSLATEAGYQTALVGPDGEQFTASIAGEADAEMIYQFHNQVYVQNRELIHPKSRAEIDNLISGDGRTFVLRDKSDQIVCKKSVIIAPRPNDISGMTEFPEGSAVFVSDATMPELQGRGLMTMLSRVACGFLTQCDDVKTGISEITVGNLPSLAQYVGHNGFVIEDVRQDPEDDTFVTIQSRDFTSEPLYVEHDDCEWVPANRGGHSMETVEGIGSWLEQGHRGVVLDQQDGGRIGFMQLSLCGLLQSAKTDRVN